MKGWWYLEQHAVVARRHDIEQGLLADPALGDRDLGQTEVAGPLLLDLLVDLGPVALGLLVCRDAESPLRDGVTRTEGDGVAAHVEVGALLSKVGRFAAAGPDVLLFRVSPKRRRRAYVEVRRRARREEHR